MAPRVHSLCPAPGWWLPQALILLGPPVDVAVTPPPPRLSSWSGPTSSRPSLDIHSWAPQFLSPATRAGVPRPRTELLSCACPDLGFQAWGVAAAVSVRGHCQTGLRRPGPRPVWVWEGARRPATPVPPRALGWGFPSVLEPGQVSHFTLRQGAGHMGPGQPRVPAQTAGLPARAPARREKPAGRGQAGSILTGPGALAGW